MNQIITSLNWRYATKKFDPDKKISESDFNDLIEAVRLTPTSFGFPHFRIINVTNPALRTAIRETAHDNASITDASHLLAITTPYSITTELIDKYLDNVSKIRDRSLESLEPFRQSLLKLRDRSQPTQSHWIQKQAYIGLGFLLVACATMQIDSCPMEGFDSDQARIILGLDSNQTVPVLCPIGYRHPDDAPRVKVRPPFHEFLVTK
jgi:nitroreductase